MRKSDIDHIQRSLFLESGKKIKSQIDNIVQSINLKYPELAGNIEIPKSIGNNEQSAKENKYMISRYINILLNQNLLA